MFLRELWPAEREIQETMLRAVTSEMFREQYADVFAGDERWKSLQVPTGDRFVWDPQSTYIRNPPFFADITMETTPLADIAGARVLALLGDSITTDHISPAGSIKKDSPAGKYLIAHGVDPHDFNSYGARRGNHEVMMRGTFANVRLRNQMAPGTEGGWTSYQPTGEVLTIYDAAMKYKDAGVPLIVVAGKEYGSGSSRDWAAKGTLLLGVKVVIAESFERIHRSNLVNMGVLPLQFESGQNAASLGLTGRERYEVTGLASNLQPGSFVTVRAQSDEGDDRISRSGAHRYAGGARRVQARRHPAVRAAAAVQVRLKADLHEGGLSDADVRSGSKRRPANSASMRAVSPPRPITPSSASSASGSIAATRATWRTSSDPRSAAPMCERWCPPRAL